MLETDKITPIKAIPEEQEAHILDIDAKVISRHPTSVWDPENPPYWSDALAEQRLLRRQKRALKKTLHNYQ